MFPRFSTGLKSALFAVSLATLASPALAETVTLRFVQTNDIDRMEENDGRGGFAKLHAVTGLAIQFEFGVHSSQCR